MARSAESLASDKEWIMGAFEDGSAFLAGVLAKVPEGLRAQVKEAFEKPEAKDAVVLLGDGVLARSDYSKHMDAVAKQDKELKDKIAATTEVADAQTRWWEANKTALTEYPTMKTELERLKAGGEIDDDGNPKPPVSTLSKDDIQKLVNDAIAAEGRGYVELNAFMLDTGLEHLRLFGERPDMRALVTNAKLGKPIANQPGRVFSLQDAYNELYGEKVAAKTKEIDDKRINDEVDKRVAEKLKGQVGNPFPLRNEGPSVLDVLETKEGPAAHNLDTAVALYEQLQATRG